MVQRTKITRIAFLLGLSVLVIGLPLSRFMMSSSQIFLVIVWLCEMLFYREARNRFSNLLHNKAFLVLISIFLLHLVGLLWTKNFDYGFHDLRNKLPLLILPLLFASSKQLSENETKTIFSLYLVALFTGVVLALYKYLFGTYSDIRNIIYFNSNIRFGLNLVIGVMICFWFLRRVSKRLKVLFVGLILLFIFFLFIVQILTAIVALLIVMTVWFFRYITSLRNKTIKRIGFTCFTLIVIILISDVYYVYCDTLPKQTKDLALLEQYTANGNRYQHDVDSKVLENGYWLGLYLCEPELCSTWKKRSNIPYFEITLVGNHSIQQTLTRYLTGKGLRKDSLGVMTLTEQDIRNIENGIANYHFAEKFAPTNRIRIILWEISEWKHNNYIAYNSVTQRFEFCRAALNTIKHHFWFGVGTGDVWDAQRNSYEQINTTLPPNITEKAHPHNQYLSVFSAFGIFGFLWFMFALLYPAISTKRFHLLLYTAFFIIIAISMLSDDTLETQAGVTLFAVFNSLLLFLVPACQQRFFEANKKTNE